MTGRKFNVGKGIIELKEETMRNYEADVIVIPNEDIDPEDRISIRDLSQEGTKSKEAFFMLPYGRKAVIKDGKRRNYLYSSIEIIAKRTEKSLEKAKELGYNSIGFPLFKGGVKEKILGEPTIDDSIDEAVSTMVGKFSEHLRKETSLKRIALILDDYDSYMQAERVAERVLNYK